jgi:hypothetical protein
MLKIYVASSWRNVHQPGVVAALREDGHEVYDFKKPKEGDDGFHWSEIDGGWKSWSTGQFIKALDHSIAKAGFDSDMEALENADVTVLVLPCGRSAHLEAGHAAGTGKKLAILLDKNTPLEPELMYRMADIITDSLALVRAFCGEVRR